MSDDLGAAEQRIVEPMAEKTWTERDGVPLNECPECGAFPEDTYDVCCTSDEAHGDNPGPEFEEVLYVPKALLDAAEQRVEAADNLAQKVEWAYNDACFTAPEDRERMNRQWMVMTTALAAYRKVSEPLADERNSQ